MNQTQDRPLISIIVPIYKVEKELDKCIESIVRQTYSNIELLLVDDGSPDNCPTKCDIWAAKDTRIKVFHTKNHGLSAARNLGIAHARGTLIAFIDSDDHIDACFLEKLQHAMSITGADIACCGVYKENELTGNVKNATLLASDVCLPSQRLLCDPAFYEWQYVVAWNKLYRKSLWNTISYPTGRYHEDEFVYHHLLMAAKKIMLIHDPLYFYVQRDTSIMATPSPKRLTDLIYAMYDRAHTLADLNGSSQVVQSSVIRLARTYEEFVAQYSMEDPNALRRLAPLVKKAAWSLSIINYRGKRAIDVLGSRISPYHYYRAKTAIKSWINPNTENSNSTK